MFKDECEGKMITEFVASASKCYSYKTDDRKSHKKAKGIVKSVRERELTHQHYKECVSKKKKKNVSQNLIRGHDLVNYTKSVSKIALNPEDSKRYILDRISTLLFGHWRLVMRDNKVIHYIDKN